MIWRNFLALEKKVAIWKRLERVKAKLAEKEEEEAANLLLVAHIKEKFFFLCVQLVVVRSPSHQYLQIRVPKIA